jgi:hypothetical protein
MFKFKVGDHFKTMKEAKEAIKAAILDTGQSFYVYKSDSTRHLLRCKDLSCKFNIRITYSKKTELATLTQYQEHECSPAIHYDNSGASSLQYLKSHHRDSIADNNTITPGKCVHISYIYIYPLLEKKAIRNRG